MTVAFTTEIHEGMEDAPKDRPFLGLINGEWNITQWDCHPWNTETPDGYWSDSASFDVLESGCDDNPTGPIMFWCELPTLPVKEGE
jgi:hypothetical protein